MRARTTTLLLFGASGDLAGRYLLPALAALEAAGRLPDRFRIIGAARDVPAAARQAVVESLHYRRVDLSQPENVERARRRGPRDGPRRRLPRTAARRVHRSRDRAGRCGLAARQPDRDRETLW